MMTTSVLDRVPVERISERAARARPGVVVLTVIAAVFFGLGWVTCKAFSGAWFAAAWCGSAVAEGWIAAKAAQQPRRT
jgi:hypothetical protein